MAARKLKSHRGAAKRFHRTGTGKLMRRKAGKRHILTSKKRDRKRHLKGATTVSKTQTLSLSRLIPYKL